MNIFHYYNHLKHQKYNLYHLLNDNGYVICSNLCRDGNSGIGALIFEELFGCYDIPSINTNGEEKSPGYVYIKRKHNI